MLIVVNIEKRETERLGIYLEQRKDRVVVENMDSFPLVVVRETIQIGDIVRRINGRTATNAKMVAKKIIASKTVSLVLERLDFDTLF